MPMIQQQRRHSHPVSRPIEQDSRTTESLMLEHYRQSNIGCFHTVYQQGQFYCQQA